jgi:hypothetical protein
MCKTIILPVVLYICEMLSLKLRKECRLRVYQDRILRRRFGRKNGQIGEWRRLHFEGLHNSYGSPNVVE